MTGPICNDVGDQNSNADLQHFVFKSQVQNYMIKKLKHACRMVVGSYLSYNSDLMLAVIISKMV